MADPEDVPHDCVDALRLARVVTYTFTAWAEMIVHLRLGPPRRVSAGVDRYRVTHVFTETPAPEPDVARLAIDRDQNPK